ncbi:uncharacterized protein LOC143227190 [Tachypleus tridentatus]|uniref:uncharacterized protein LOC143227190 n=1 Tax=Tachypleus tridentatus TaxID=6853 RepID=UPI003FD4F4B8
MLSSAIAVLVVTQAILLLVEVVNARSIRKPGQVVFDTGKHLNQKWNTYTDYATIKDPIYNDGYAAQRGRDDETTFRSVIKTVSEDPGVTVSRLLPTKYQPARPSPPVNYPAHYLEAASKNKQYGRFWFFLKKENGIPHVISPVSKEPDINNVLPFKEETFVYPVIPTDMEFENEPIITDLDEDEYSFSIACERKNLFVLITKVVIGFLCFIYIVTYVAYRMMIKGEGSYLVEEPKKIPLGKLYTPSNSKEVYF